MAVAGPAAPAGLPALTAAEIAVILGGTLEGEGSQRVTSVAPLHRARSDQLSFLADKRYASMLSDSSAGVVLVARELRGVAGRVPARVIVDKPYDALVALLPKLYVAPPRPSGVHATALVAPGVTLGPDASVGAFAVIDAGASVGARAWIGPQSVVGAGVQIGDDCQLVSQVTCYPGTVLGKRVILHAGVRVGSDGFGYAFADGAHQRIPHIGRCVIEDDVEIGANSCVDRGSIDDTVIGAGTKIDNLVHVAHNVRLGRLCLLMAQVGIAGSAHIEDGAILAGQVGVGGHLTIGAGARIGAQAGVIGDVPAGETWSGYPARPHKESMRASAALLQLPELLKQLGKRSRNDG